MRGVLRAASPPGGEPVSGGKAAVWPLFWRGTGLGARTTAPVRTVLGGALATLCLAGLTGVYFWPVLNPSATLSLGGDFAAQTYPWRRYITEEMFQGRLPHWAPYVGFGFPLLADIETTVFYPVSLLVSLVAGPQVSYRTLEMQSALHHVIAGVGMWLLLDRLGTRWLAALAGAIAFTFSGFLWAHAAHLTVIQSASWGPWVLLGGAHLLERPRGRAVAGTGLALALAILGGHPQIPYYLGLALLMTLGLGWWKTARRPAPEARNAASAGRLWRAAAAAGLLGVGLAAVQLLPTAVLARESIRWKVPSAFLLGDTLPLEQLITLAVPLAFHGTGGWASVDELHAYMGVLPLVLVAWALARPWSRWTAVFVALVLFGLLAALGLPPFSWLGSGGLFRIPARAVYLFDLGIAGLTGLGVEALLRAPRRRSVAERRLLWALRGMVAAAGAGGAWLLLAGVPPSIRAALSPEFAVHYMAFAALLLASAIVVEIGCRFRGEPVLVGGAVVAVLLFDIFTFSRALAWSAVPPEGHWPRIPEAAELTGRLGPHRVFGDGILGRSQTMEANMGLTYRVPLSSVYSSLRLSRHEAFWERLAPTLAISSNLYDVMAVGLVVSRRDVARWTGPTTIGLQGFEEVVPDPRIGRLQAGVWTVRDSLPRAHLPAEVLVIRDKPTQLARLATLDPRRTVLLERRPALCPPRSLRWGAPGEVEMLVDEPDRVRLRVRAADTGPLVLSDTNYPGWRATLDGAPTKIYQANFLFRAVCVPAGEHLVEFRFRQPGFLVGLALTGLACVGTVLLVRDGPAVSRFLATGRYRRLTVRRSKKTPVLPR